MIYQRIRDLREDKDLKQQDIADAIGCSQVCYSRYECGKRMIPPEILIKLAVFHHTSTDYLLGLTNNPNPYNDLKK
ncbi:MAG: helix-turn-helix transcriptional regulator [Oscillospiraceae bacterium]|nr:helix-turn-helix transcriptional regulator [Oscillospiraceae bacterium]